MDEAQAKPDDGGIKSLLINPILYNNIELSIKTLRTIEYLSGESEDTKRFIKTLLTLLSSDYGLPVLEHLLLYGAYTYREIELKLGTSKTTVHYITNKLVHIGFIEPKTVVMPLDHKSPGMRPRVYVIVGADPQLSVNCINRYYELSKNESIEYPEPVIIYDFSEKGQSLAETWIKYFMREDRLYLDPNPLKLKDSIRKDAPDIGLDEREGIVRHIMEKVRELREASP